MEWLKASVDYGIIGFLAVLSIVSLAVAIERHLVFRGVQLDKFNEKKRLELELTRRLHIIATIGSNTPYIGLLGTVLGIMLTFYTIGQEGLMDSGKIMSGLALALKATAAGLVVAIPSVTMYNFLLRRVKVIIGEWELSNERRERV